MRTLPFIEKPSPLPYGTLDLNPEIAFSAGPPLLMRCVVRGCKHLLRAPSRGDRGEACPEHEIYSHRSRTYSYRDARRNIIASPNLFATRLLGHGFKYETHRFGLENSEDALTWNVFRSLQEAGCLREVACWITGDYIAKDPQLFLWGIRVDDDSFEPWDLLIEARKRFESNLPVKRPLTEPDVALFLPGYYVILIEAKFTSANTWYKDGCRKDAASLTKQELLEIYRDESLQILDRNKAKSAERIFYQLWRGMTFAEWIAGYDSLRTQAFQVSLTRARCEEDSCREFVALVQPHLQHRFMQVNWEELYGLCPETREQTARLRNYLKTKTTNLATAFRI